VKIQHTPAPYPSTILSLSPAESFPYQDARIQAITLDPDASTYTLSGPRAEHPSGKLRMYTLPRNTPLPPAIPQHIQTTLTAEFSRYATPALRAAQSRAPRQHLADPSGPAPTSAQQDSIRNSAGRTQPALPPQPQHLAAPAPGAHRAGR
jgi:hypothetical protein